MNCLTKIILTTFVIILLSGCNNNESPYVFSEYQLKHGLYTTQEILETGGVLDSKSLEVVLYMRDGNETRKAIITSHNKSFDQLSNDFAKAQENYKKSRADSLQ